MVINMAADEFDTSLPFFAYGIFKPGQLAYHIIEDYVIEKEEETIGWISFYRDGIPILVGEIEGFETKGYLLSFNNPEAYDKINEFKLMELYFWKEIRIGDGIVNVLLGKNPELGSFPHESPIVDFDGKDDPFFKEGMELIENYIENKIDEKVGFFDYYNKFFEIQMHYMLLWSIIERFGSLKYGKSSINQNNKELAKEKLFKKYLKLIEREDFIYTTDDLEEKELNKNKNIKSIKYYYTIRCNVSHRGKTMKPMDRKRLRESLKELYGIFSIILEDSFK